MTRDYTHLPTAWDQLHPESESNDASNPTQRSQDESSEDQLRVAARAHNNPEGAEHNAQYSPKDPTPPEVIMRFWGLISDDVNARAFQTILAFLIFVATIGIAVIYAKQLCQMIEQNRLTRENFNRDQRPYIWLVPCNPKILRDSTNKKLFANIPFANFGKTPAIGVKAVGRIFLGDDARQKGHDWIVRMRSETFDKRDISVGIVPQGFPASGITPYSVPAWTETVPTDTEWKDAMAANFGIVAVARIEYFGTDPRKRMSADICLERVINGSFGSCHNPEDNGIQ